jgi:Domain of unknown function (DUF1902)
MKKRKFRATAKRPRRYSLHRQRKRRPVPRTTITVKAGYDPETSTWYVVKSSLDGLFLEGDTLDQLHAEIVGGIEDLTGEANAEVNLILPGRQDAA